MVVIISYYTGIARNGKVVKDFIALYVQNRKTASQQNGFGGAKGDNDIPIKIADDAYLVMQILAVDFETVLVAKPHKVTKSSKAYSDYFAGTR